MVCQTCDSSVPFSPPWFDAEEEGALLSVLRSGWVTTGPKVRQFEAAVAGSVGASHGVATYSCTDALLLALRVLGVDRGDEVITTVFTFPATAQAICQLGAKPVFVDVDAATFNLDAAKIEPLINGRTKAILPVHYGGHPCEMDWIQDIARRHRLHVVEDAAHALGSEYRGRPIGSLSDITCFSFYATKNICTAEGGMAVTNDENWARRMRVLSMYGISDAREVWQERHRSREVIHFNVTELGYKCNMTDLSAALGLVQLKKLRWFNRIREQFATIYDKAFSGAAAVRIPVIKDGIQTCRHLYPILLDTHQLSVTRDEFIRAMADAGVSASVMFVPLHFHRYFAELVGHVSGDFPIAEQVFARVLCLPISPRLGESAIHRVSEVVLELLERYRR